MRILEEKLHRKFQDFWSRKREKWSNTGSESTSSRKSQMQKCISSSTFLHRGKRALSENGRRFTRGFFIKINSFLPNIERFCEAATETHRWMDKRRNNISLCDLLKKQAKKVFFPFSWRCVTPVWVLHFCKFIQREGSCFILLGKKSRHSKELSNPPAWKWRTEAQRADR